MIEYGGPVKYQASWRNTSGLGVMFAVMVNLLFFPPEFAVAFRGQVKRHGLSRRFRNKAV